MRAHGQRSAPARRLARVWARRRSPPAAAALESLAITAGYVLLGWTGHQLRLGGNIIVIWPAAGFALAVLLVRGASRWPGVLSGSFLTSYLFLDAGVFQQAPPAGAAPALLGAVLTSAGRTLSTVGGAWLVVRLVGTRRWPHTTRGVLGFALVAGLLYPAASSLLTQLPQAALLPVPSGLGFWREAWIWFVANSTGSIIVAPLLLALLEPPVDRPRRSRVELALTTAAFLVATVLCLDFAREAATPIPLAYPFAPLMLWSALRFGSRGAVLNNALWTLVLLSVTLSRPSAVGLTQLFAELHARLAVLSTVMMALAAAFEERHTLQHALERERASLEARVADRTRELAHFLSLLHSSLESTADGLLVVDLQGRILATNARFGELWRLPPNILESGDDERALAYVVDQLASPESFLARVEYLYAHPELESEDEVALKDGRIFERFSRPQRLGAEVVGRVWSFRDVTLRRRTEAERNRLLVEESRARHEAERALALRDDFLQVAAHEMKTPVTSMKLQLQQLLRLFTGTSPMPPDPARVQALAEAVLRPMRRFEDLSEQLLDVKRVETGALAPHYEPLDFEEVVRDEVEAYRGDAARAGSELRFECAGEIPGECDRRQLEQIASGLLSNAIKFGAGSPLTVRLEASPERVLLQVIDAGIGIALEDQRRILERFERAVDSRHYGGLGLGLWLVREAAEALGGEVRVESELGRGSSFSVLLPRVRPGARRAVELADGAPQHG